MKNVDRSTQSSPGLLAALTLMSAVAVTVLPGVALAADAAAAQGAAATSPAEPKAASAAPRGVDGLIAHLHAQFKITPAQEPLFQKLAEVMRADAENMSSLAKKRAENSRTMSAVDDLKSYAEISAAHAEGTRKMIPPFQALYDSLSEAQKKAADEEFRDHYATHHHHAH